MSDKFDNLYRETVRSMVESVDDFVRLGAKDKTKDMFLRNITSDTYNKYGLPNLTQKPSSIKTEADWKD